MGESSQSGQRGTLRGSGLGWASLVWDSQVTVYIAPRCATTHNYDRDRAWGYCMQVPAPQEGPGGCLGVWDAKSC